MSTHLHPLLPSSGAPARPDHAVADVSLDDLSLEQILDVPAVQSLMDHFHALTGMGMAIVDMQGTVLVATGWQDICTKFHRVHPQTQRHCVESDTQLSRGVPAGTFKLYCCKNNMWDIATPIMIGERHLGNLFLGQFFFDDDIVDREIFREQARHCGFDEERYMAALERVPRWSRERVDTAMHFYAGFATMISRLSHSNIQLAHTLRERDRLLDSLQESEEKYRTIADFTYDWEYWQAPDASLIYVSPSCERVTGYSRDAFMQDPGMLRAILHPEDQDRLTCLRVENIPALEDKHFESDLRIITRSGELRWIAHSCQAVHSRNGRFLGRRGSNRDITMRKQAEQEIIRTNEELRKVVAEKDAFFSIIAHDLKSPLSGLLGMTGLLVEDIEGLSLKELRQLASEMGQSVQNLFNLLENLLEWSQMQRGLTTFEPGPCLLHQLVERNVDLIQAVADQKGIVLRNAVPEEITVFADSRMLNTVLRNLLSNAVKFSNPGGAVVVSATQDENMVTVEVRDSGIGMDQKTVSGLFALDKKKSVRGTAGERGTGLGLILSKEFVEKHGGRIWAESEPGEGSTFFFALPLPRKDGAEIKE
jgi:PAS domain S-box-containing protein